MGDATASGRMADVRDMHLAHRMFRREFRLLPGLIRDAAPGDLERSAIVADHAVKMCTMLEAHHEGEDQVIWPLLLARGGQRSAAVVPVMERQHQGVHEALAALTRLLPAWRATAQGGAELASCADALAESLIEHMALEEEEILPLAEEYMTAEEWAAFGEHAFAAVPKKTLALGFGMIMYEGDSEVIKEVLAGAPFVPRIVMPILGPRLYASHAKRVHGTATPPRLGR